MSPSRPSTARAAVLALLACTCGDARLAMAAEAALPGPYLITSSNVFVSSAFSVTRVAVFASSSNKSTSS